MTTAPIGKARLSKRRRAALLLLAVGVFGLAPAACFLLFGLRINLTPSEPIGLYRILSLERNVKVGDLIFICPPDTPLMRQGFKRGYLRPGLCPAGFAPLIKAVLARPGQRYSAKETLEIEGITLSGAIVLPMDQEGRRLDPAGSGVVPEGNVLVFSPYRASWDSRYFGPIPQSGILGLAGRLVTLDLK